MIFVINNLSMSLLVQYDLETYEKIFGEIEEA